MSRIPITVCQQFSLRFLDLCLYFCLCVGTGTSCSLPFKTMLALKWTFFSSSDSIIKKKKMILGLCAEISFVKRCFVKYYIFWLFLGTKVWYLLISLMMERRNENVKKNGARLREKSKQTIMYVCACVLYRIWSCLCSVRFWCLLDKVVDIL